MHTTSMTLDDLYRKLREESTEPEWVIQVLHRFFRDKEIIQKPMDKPTTESSK